MEQVQILRIVVASPGDVRPERDALEKVTAELNRGVAAMAGLRLEVSRWETDAYPGFHSQGPQGLIDPILKVADCDLLIGIFWKHFGTPTPDGTTGTEHEFHTAYDAWKRTGRPQIMVYFNQKPYAPGSQAEAAQWGKVLEFRQNFPKEGLWWPYKGKGQFEELVRNHLTQFLRHRMSGAAQPAATGTTTATSPSGSAPAPTGLTAGKRDRLKRKRDALERESELRSEKLNQLRAAFAVEAAAAVRFQLEQQIKDEQSALERLDKELDYIEQSLR
jgi:hypothetical protein